MAKKQVKKKSEAKKQAAPSRKKVPSRGSASVGVTSEKADSQQKAEEKRRQRAAKQQEKKKRKAQQLLHRQQRQQLEQQLAQENQEAYQALLHRRRQWKRSRRRHYYVLILLVLALSGILICFRMFLTITEIRVSGESRYSDEQLILSSGLKIGEHLYDFDAELVEQEILGSHVYLESVTVKRVLPTIVEIQVTPVMETGVIQSETGFSVISTGGKILETGILYPPSELPIISGLQLSVDQTDEEKVNKTNKQLQTLSTLNAAMTASKFTGVTEIDLTDMLNITVVYQDRVRINLGDNSNLDEKIALVAQALMDVDPSIQGVMDASIEKTIFFHEESIHPDYTPAEPEVDDESQAESLEGEESAQEDATTQAEQSSTETQTTEQSSGSTSQVPQIPQLPDIP